MNLDQITPLIICHNESANILRTLDAVRWAARIVVVDGGSNDPTLELIKRIPQAEVFFRRFDTHAQQWNFGIQQVTSEFTLSLDADYLVGPKFVSELEKLDESAATAWFASFRYIVMGRALRGTLLPPRLVLFRTEGARYYDDGHTQALERPQRLGVLREPILHDDLKPLNRWLDSQLRYSALEAQKLLSQPWRGLGWPDRLRRGYLGPVLIVPYCLLVKGLILDGRAGLFYTAQRFTFEALLVLRLLHAKLTPSLPSGPAIPPTH